MSAVRTADMMGHSATDICCWARLLAQDAVCAALPRAEEGGVSCRHSVSTCDGRLGLPQQYIKNCPCVCGVVASQSSSAGRCKQCALAGASAVMQVSVEVVLEARGLTQVGAAPD